MKQRYEHASQRMRERMEEKRISVRELSSFIQCSYENTRHIVHGRRRIPEPTARLICKYLEIQMEELDRLQNLDQSRLQTASLNHSSTPMERFWAYLSEEHRQDLVCLARRWAGQDRVAKRSGEDSDPPESSFAVGS